MFSPVIYIVLVFILSCGECKCRIVLSIMLLLVLLGIAINVPCESVVAICPNIEMTFTCSVQNIRLTWIVPESLTDSSNSNTDPLTLITDSTVTATNGPYNAVIIEGNNSYVLSELTFTVPQELSGTKEISCTPNVGINNDDEKKTCMIKLAEGVSTLYMYST